MKAYTYVKPGLASFVDETNQLFASQQTLLCVL